MIPLRQIGARVHVDAFDAVLYDVLDLPCTSDLESYRHLTLSLIHPVWMKCLEFVLQEFLAAQQYLFSFFHGFVSIFRLDSFNLAGFASRGQPSMLSNQ